MTLPSLHQSPAHQHPVPLEIAVPIVLVGLAVFLVVAYDLYRNGAR